MPPHRHHRHTNPLELEDKIIRAAMIGLYMVGSIVVAYWIGKGEQKLLIFLGLFFAACMTTIGLRHRAWMLILLGWSITGTTAVISVPFSIHDITIMLAACSYVAFRVVSPRSDRPSWHILDAVVGLNLLYLVFTFFHHPVGLRAFGSETIGARPYVNIGLGLVAYWVIFRLPDSARTASWAPFLLLIGVSFVTMLYLISYVFPSAVSHLSFLYAVSDVGAYFSNRAVEAPIPRFLRFGEFGLTLVFVLCAYYPPRTLFDLRKVRSYALLLALSCVLLSGFRNILLKTIMVIVITCFFYRTWRELAIATLVGGLLVGCLIFGQGRLFDLPLPAQRALAWLPGQWSPTVLADVQSSSEGRFQVWKDVIRYNLIDDWWFGDGFGMTEEDAQTVYSIGSTDEWVMLTGSYHSGPLTAVRFVGGVGLILFYVLMAAVAYYSVVYVRRCWGTPLQPLAIYLAVQGIWSPIHYTFVFGGYDSELPQYLLYVGLLRLLIRMTQEMEATARPSAVKAVSPGEVVASAT